MTYQKPLRYQIHGVRGAHVRKEIFGVLDAFELPRFLLELPKGTLACLCSSAPVRRPRGEGKNPRAAVGQIHGDKDIRVPSTPFDGFAHFLCFGLSALELCFDALCHLVSFSSSQIFQAAQRLRDDRAIGHLDLNRNVDGAAVSLLYRPLIP